MENNNIDLLKKMGYEVKYDPVLDGYTIVLRSMRFSYSIHVKANELDKKDSVYRVVFYMNNLIVKGLDKINSDKEW